MICVHVHMLFFISRTICIKSCIVPKIPMIKELEQGMNLFGVLNAVRQQPRLFEGVFVESGQFDITLDDLLDSLEVCYSQSQFLKEAEEDVFKYFSDTMQSIAHSGTWMPPLVFNTCSLNDPNLK